MLLLFFLSLIIIPLSMYLVHQRALAKLCRGLSRAAGTTVTLNGLWGTLKPSLIIDGLTIGGASPLISINRTELLLDISDFTRPKVKAIHLYRPSAHLSLGDLDPAGTVSHRGLTLPARDQTPHAFPDVIIEEGTLSGYASYQERDLSFKITGINFQQSTPFPRLVLGESTITDGTAALILSATALDLNPRSLLHFQRLATMGGTLKLHGVKDPGFQIHLITIKSHPEGYWVQLKGASPGQGSGKLAINARLDPTLRPSGINALTLTLEAVDLTWWGPLINQWGLRAKGTTVSGTLKLKAADGFYLAATRFDTVKLGLSHPLLAPSTVVFPQLKFEGNLRVTPRGELSTEDFSARMGKAQIFLRGKLQLTDQRLRMTASLSIPRLRCQDLLTATPSALVPELRGLALGGDIELNASLVLDSSNLSNTRADLSFPTLDCRVLIDPAASDVHRLKEEVKITVRNTVGAPAELLLGPSNKHYIPYEDLSRHLRRAFIVAEDSHFFQHQGFDQRQLHRAFLNNLEPNSSLRGASTISQQLIKNIFLSHERTLSRKIQEAVLTWRMEQVISKRRILELYLNLVEMGPGIYGVGQAAEAYFHSSATALGPVNSARLAALTPAPRLYAKMLGSLDEHPPLKKRIELLLRLMQRNHGMGAVSKKSGVPQLTFLQQSVDQ